MDNKWTLLQQEDNKVIFSNNTIRISLESYANGCIHVLKEKNLPHIKSEIIVLKPNGNCKEIIENDQVYNCIFNNVMVSLNKTTGTLAFYNSNKKLIQETNAYLKDKKILNEKCYEIKQQFNLTKDESLYGLGQFHDGVVNYRNYDARLAQGYLVSVNPFLVSTNGYGIMWDNYSESYFHDNIDGMFFSSTVANTIDYYLFVGENMDRIISSYREITGVAPMFAKWTYGYQQCRCTYESFEEVQSIVDGYRSRQIPLDCVVQDWNYWGSPANRSPLCFGEKGFEHPRKAIEKLHDNHVKLLVSIWPMIGKETEIYKELDCKNYLLGEL